jgi:hypothetical protein
MKERAQLNAHEWNDFSFETNKSNALTAFPDSAWALQPALRQVTLLAGIRAGRCDLHHLPNGLFQSHQWFEMKAGFPFDRKPVYLPLRGQRRLDRP